MLFLQQAVQGLLTSSFSFPNLAFFRDVLLRGDGFGNCETCRSTCWRCMVRSSTASPAYCCGWGQRRKHRASEAASQDEAESCKLAVLVEWFTSEQAAPFKTFGHFLKCLMEKRFLPKHMQTAQGPCAALSAAKSPSHQGSISSKCWSPLPRRRPAGKFYEDLFFIWCSRFSQYNMLTAYGPFPCLLVCAGKDLCYSRCQPHHRD